MSAKQHIEATLWDIANALRGKMSADDTPNCARWFEPTLENVHPATDTR
ncbi:MAG: hypothetical protein JNL52_12405 [Flavobacteriales bacterium]|nr:hypothetical protein [Flavobacteriales bacterium]